MESEKRIETYERTSQLSVICSHRSFPHQLFAIPYSLFATPHSPLATYHSLLATRYSPLATRPPHSRSRIVTCNVSPSVATDTRARSRTAQAETCPAGTVTATCSPSSRTLPPNSRATVAT
jgi:hypothetical protein